VPLFKWLHSSKLADNNEYQVEDFRKVVVYLAKHLSSVPEVEELLVKLGERQGKDRVRDFMEIHLMHFQQQYNAYINWYCAKYKPEAAVPVEHVAERVKLP
jgi:predicted ATPase